MMGKKEGYLWNRKWLWILILIGVSLILSYMKPLRLAEGGEVTYLSMLVIYLVGYFYGGWTGVAAAFLYGALKYFWQIKSMGFRKAICLRFF